MLQVVNHSPFTAALSVFPDPAGVETAYAVVKATFLLGAQGPEVAPAQLPLLAADVHWGAPVSTSLRAAAEFSLLRTTTDILLTGRAIAPTADTRVAEVSLRVGPVQRRLRVFGNRHWQHTSAGWRISAPAVWQRMPLRWELAYGGVAPAADNQPPEYEARNPVGVGFIAHQAQPLDGQALPNLEDPEHLIQTPQDRPDPAAFAPVAPTWQPRRQYAGTYDEAWTRTRAPYLPQDFDPRFFQVAPPALQARTWLQGGEPVQLQGVTAGGPIEFELPGCGLEIDFRFRGATVPRPPQLELVLFEPDAGRFQMLWRAALPVDKHLLKLESLNVRSRAWDRSGQARTPLQALGQLPSAYADAA